jgi:1,4-alpha-glucan branching enzyme
MLIDDGERRPMIRHEAGVFDLFLEDRHKVFGYRLEVYYRNSSVSATRHSYAFMPTLGDLDIHLWSEGSHERAWEQSGAHQYEIDGVQGISFSVWAPNAAGLSVVGNFNDWDGRLHMLRTHGTSGIWETFIPDLDPGVIYEYEIHTHDDVPVLKADPFATAAELPPRSTRLMAADRRVGYCIQFE